MRELPCTRLEADEIWCYVGKKQRRLPPCPLCRGPVAAGEGYASRLATCVVCGDRRAA